MTSKLGPDNTPAALLKAGWNIEASPPNVGAEHPSTVRLTISPVGKSRLTGPGVNGVIAQFNTYLTAAKATSIQLRAGLGATPGATVSPGGGWIDLLPEDGPAQITALVAVLQTAGNIT